MFKTKIPEPNGPHMIHLLCVSKLGSSCMSTTHIAWCGKGLLVKMPLATQNWLNRRMNISHVTIDLGCDTM